MANAKSSKPMEFVRVVGARGRKRKQLHGQRFGSLWVIRYLGHSVTNNQAYYQCMCKCGLKFPVAKTNLKPDRDQTCGPCADKKFSEKFRGKPIPHLAGKTFPRRQPPRRKPVWENETREYKIWVGLKHRCLNPNFHHYENYGGRGITVCDRWRYSYKNFLADMGRRPSDKHSIDRINNDGNYEPGNCRWATRSQQNLNRRKPRPKSLTKAAPMG